MKLLTTLEINEIETEVLVSFHQQLDGEIEIHSIRNVHTDELEDINLVSDALYSECHEYAADDLAERRRTRKINYLSL